MCSRYALIANADRLQQQFDRELMEELIYRPEIRIGQLGPIVLRQGIKLSEFGIRTSEGKRVFNARSETWRDKPLFRDLQPCLVPATAFWEWSQEKEKVEFVPDELEFFVFPALVSTREFAILTEEPDEVVRPIHDRMPICLDPRNADGWFDRDLPKKRARIRKVIEQASLF
jgi:putative SOS response-associated peptidase YedK